MKKQDIIYAYHSSQLVHLILFLVITSAISSKLLMKIERKKLMLIVSIIPLIGHGIIFLDENCTDIPTNIG
jgi:hypothetical protein